MRLHAGSGGTTEGPMIDFSFTDEQWALRELAHDFAANEIRPVAWEYDREATWPQAIIEKAWEVGLMHAHIPEEYGGAGASFIDGVLIEEEMGWGCSGIGTSRRSPRSPARRP
jgi:acyl-CoA dehydrogenase